MARFRSVDRSHVSHMIRYSSYLSQEGMDSLVVHPDEDRHISENKHIMDVAYLSNILPAGLCTTFWVNIIYWEDRCTGWATRTIVPDFGDPVVRAGDVGESDVAKNALSQDLTLELGKKAGDYDDKNSEMDRSEA